MKKMIILIAVVVATTILLSSCNQQVCPAYSNVKAEQTQNNNS